MTSTNLNDIEGHTTQARDFLARGRRYLAGNDLHQAPEKGWGQRHTWRRPWL